MCGKALLLLLTVLAVCTASSKLHAAMVLPGDFKVSTVGAATYDIPIQVPPGIAGIEPSLSLHYDSNSGNGLLGVGWNLSGLSSITRCPRTPAQDGVRGSVSYDDNDRFCLDGRRLIVVKGVYGANESEYRTELESFTKITAYGAAGTAGPLYFIVKTRAGLTTEYGRSSDSALEVLGKSPAAIRTWALSKVQDSKGNTLTVTYQKYIPNSSEIPSNLRGKYFGSHAPLRIDYTSNTGTSLAAKNAVIFGYDYIRPDVSSGYQGGTQISNYLRLRTITTSDVSAVAVYTLTYEQGPATKRSRLTKIELCGSSSECLPATLMTFPAEPTSVFDVDTHLVTESQLEFNTGTINSVYGVWRQGDVNGDGKQDLFQIWNGNLHAWLSLDGKTFESKSYLGSSPTVNPGFGQYDVGQWLTLDLNGDGKTDVVHALGNRFGGEGPYPSEIISWIPRDDGTMKVASYLPPNEPVLNDGGFLVLDVNGDGRSDLVKVKLGYPNPDRRFNVYISRGDGIFDYSTQSRTQGNPNDYGTWQVLDVNGDGLLDLVNFNENYSAAWVWTSTGTGQFVLSQTSTGISASPGIVRVGDFNGDHLTDIVLVDGVGGNTIIRTLFSKGDGTFSPTVVSVGTPYYSTYPSSYITVTDLNGDGFSDLVHVISGESYEESGVLGLWLSDGKGGFSVSKFTTPKDTTAVTNCDDSCSIIHIADFKGEGFEDLFTLNNQQIGYWTRQRISKDIPISITPSPRRNISWRTDTLPKLLGTSYFKEKREIDVGIGATASSLSWPWISPVSPLAVVTDVTVTANDTRTTAYSYGTALVEAGVNGRGFSGFNWQQSVDPVNQSGFKGTGLVKRSYFKQDFPFTGMLEKVGQGTSAQDWSNLSLTTNTYDCKRPNEPVELTMSDGCTATPGSGARYFPYLASSISTANDLNLAPMPGQIKTNSELDAFGNFQLIESKITRPGDLTLSGFSTKAHNTFYNDPDRWYLGRLVQAVTTKTTPDPLPAPVVPGPGDLPGMTRTSFEQGGDQDLGVVGFNSDSGRWPRFTNSGTVPVVIQGHSATGGLWAWQGNTADPQTCFMGNVIAVGGSCYTFNGVGGTAVGNYSPSATLTYAQQGSNVSFTTVTNYTVSIATIAASRPGIDFGTMQQNQWNGPIVVHVTNNATSNPLRNVVISFSGGNSSNFSTQGATCGGAIAGGAHCDIPVYFNPTSNANGLSSTLVVTGGYPRMQPGETDYIPTNTAVNIQIPVKGNGAFSKATLTSAASQSFGGGWYGQAASALNWNYRNDGNVAMTLTSPSLSAPLRVTGNTCSNVAVGASCAIAVTNSWNSDAPGTSQSFTPTGATVAPAAATASYVVYSAVPVWGATSLNFGNVTVGQTATQNVTLYNYGASDTYNWAANNGIANLPADFSFNLSACSGVAPGAGGGAQGGSCNVVVSFTPTVAGARGGSSVYVAAASYGLSPPGRATWMSVAGTGIATATQPTVSFNPASVITGATSTLSWSSTGAASYAATCSGAAVGSYTGTATSMTVSTSGTGTGTCSVTALNSLGTASAAGAANLTVTPAAVLFTVTGPSTNTWTFTNPNSFAVTPTAVGRNGTNDFSAFTSINAAGTTCSISSAVPAGGTCTVAISAAQPRCKADNYTVRAAISTSAGMTNGAYLSKSSTSTICP